MTKDNRNQGTQTQGGSQTQGKASNQGNQPQTGQQGRGQGNPGGTETERRAETGASPTKDRNDQGNMAGRTNEDNSRRGGSQVHAGNTGAPRNEPSRSDVSGKKPQSDVDAVEDDDSETGTTDRNAGNRNDGGRTR